MFNQYLTMCVGGGGGGGKGGGWKVSVFTCDFYHARLTRSSIPIWK